MHGVRIIVCFVGEVKGFRDQLRNCKSETVQDSDEKRNVTSST